MHEDIPIRYRNCFGLICLLAALKAVLLAVYRPVFTPDSIAYVAYADLLLHQGAQLGRLDLHASAADVSALRMIGFPAVIAFFKFSTGNAWPYALCIFQGALSLLLTFPLYRFCRRLGLTETPAICAVAAYAAAYPLIQDQMILSDSIYSSLIILFWCSADALLFSDRPFPLLRYSFAALCAAATALIRDSIQFQLLLFAPWLASSLKWRPAIPKVIRILVLLAAPAVTLLLYGSWNESRSGAFFLTTAPQWYFLQPVMEVAEGRPEVLAGQDPLSQTARETFKAYDFPEIWKINKTLFDRYGLTALDIGRLTRNKYVELWSTHPLLMMRHSLGEWKAEIFFAPFRTLESIRDLAEQSDPAAHWPSNRRMLERLPSTWRSWEVLFVLLVDLSRLAGVTVSLFFLIGVPILYAREQITGGATRDSLRLLSYWAVFLLNVISFSMIHIDMRYLMPVLPFSCVIGTMLVCRYGSGRTAKPLIE